MIVFLPKKAEWFGPYQLLSPLEKALVKLGFDEDYVYINIVSPIAEKMPEKPFRLFQAFRNLAPWRRDVLIEHDHDFWSFDYKIAKIVLPGLYAIKKEKQGIPGDFITDSTDYRQPDLFDNLEFLSELSFENSIKRWDEAIDKMIFSFENLIFGCETSLSHWEPYWEPMNEKEREEFLKKTSLRSYYEKDSISYKINEEKYKIFNQKMKEGFELFGKHFTSLYT